MTIGEYIKLTDIETYNKLKKLCRLTIDKPENLMKHDAYKRVRGALRQIRWG